MPGASAHSASILRNLPTLDPRPAAAYLLRPYRVLRAVRPEHLRPDLIAGLTVAVILLPQAMAYALIAELPPAMGIYTAIIGSIVGALWGSSIHLQTGPTNAASLLILATLITVAYPGSPEYLLAAGVLTLMVGLIRLAMGLARLGLLVNFVSDSVITGFTAGAGLLITANQLRNLLGLDVPSSAELSQTLANLATHSDEINLPSLALGLLTILVILLVKRFAPRLPGPLIAISLATLLNAAATAILGEALWDVSVIGSIPSGLPPLARLPVLNLGLVQPLFSGALAIAAVGLVEALSIARGLAAQSNQRLDSNQEFVGQGMANIASAVFSGFTCSGSFTRSAVNFSAGARSPLSNVFGGLFVLLAMLVFRPLASAIPLSSLAGVVIVISIGLIDLPEIRRVWRGAPGDRNILAVTFVSTLLLPLQFAVLSGILISLVYYLVRTSTPVVHMVVPDQSFEFFREQGDLPACPQLGVIEILGDLYFGATHHVEEVIHKNREQHPSQRFLLLRTNSVDQIDISGVHMLEAIAKSYRQLGGDIYITRYQKAVLQILRDSGFSHALGEDHFLGRDRNAIQTIYTHVLDPAICIYECPHRVFKECQNLPKRLDLIGEIEPALAGALKLPALAPAVTTSAAALWQALHEPQPPLVIDVREPREFRSGHIPQAQNIPLPGLLANLQQLPADQTLVLVCRGGRRSSRAAAMLQQQGFQKAGVLGGGMLAWEAANLLVAFEELPHDRT